MHIEWVKSKHLPEIQLILWIWKSSNAYCTFLKTPESASRKKTGMQAIILGI